MMSLFKKYLKTPVGNLPIPNYKRMQLDKLTDEQLIDEHNSVWEKTGFIDPFLFNELRARGLHYVIEKSDKDEF